MLPPELDALLRVVAENLCKNCKTDTDLCPLASHFHEKVAIVAALNQHVQICDPNYHIEEVDYKRVDYEVFGPAIFCARIDKRTGQRQLFFIGPYVNGMQYCNEVSEAVYKQRCDDEQASRQRSERLQLCKQDFDELCIMLLGKLKQLIVSSNVSEKQRADANLKLSLISTQKHTAEMIVQIADVCRDIGSNLQELIAK